MNNYILLLTTLIFGLFAWGQPANDNCVDAIEITDLDNFCTTVNNSGASFDSYVGECMEYANNIWFSFTAQGNTIDIDVSGVNRPEFFLSYSPNGDPCDVNDAVGLLCETDGANYAEISGTYEYLIPGETYYIQVVNNLGGGQGGSGDVELCVDNPVSPAVELCDDIQAFCSDSPTTFEAATNTTSPDGPAYDCLLTQPNPAWFFLEIDDPGDIEITMTPDPLVDIDYVLWGPFNSVEDGCQGGITAPENVEDCSYAPDAVETANIQGANQGDIYILLITNFSNDEADITVTQTSGTASTNCEIVLPVELLYFNVENENNTNVINWATASETNNNFFTINYSSDGQNWREIANIPGAGNTNTEQNYSFKHRSFSSDINYYYLTQTDYDGTTENFNIKTVDNRSDLEVVKIVNLMGQEVTESFKGVVIYRYSDGSTEKRYQR